LLEQESGLNMDANTLGWILFGTGVVFSWIALKTTFFGIKLMSGIWWIIIFMYLRTNVPTALAQGGPVHTGMLVVSIGTGLMIVLAGLGRGIKTQQSTSINGTMRTVESEGFHLPDWMRNIGAEDLEQEERRANTNQKLADYRQTLRDSYNRRARR